MVSLVGYMVARVYIIDVTFKREQLTGSLALIYSDVADEVQEVMKDLRKANLSR